MSFITGKRAYIKNLSSSYLPYFVRIIVTIIITPILINTFGQEQYGIYVLLYTFITYFTLSNIGLPQTIVREIIMAKEKKDILRINQIISSGFFYYLLTLIFLVLFTVVTFYLDIFNLNSKILNTDNKNLINIFSLGMFIVSLFFGVKLFTEMFEAIVRATNRIYIVQIIRSVNAFLLGIGTYISLKLYGTIESVLIINTITSFFVLFILILQLKKYISFKIEFKNSSYKIFKQMIPSSFWYCIGGLGMLLIFQTDTIIISTIIGLSSITIYALMFKFTDIFRQMLTNVVTVMFSDIAMYYTKNQFDIIFKKYKKILIFTIMISLAVAIFLYFIGYELFKFWIGEENAGSINLFIYFIIYMVLFSINQVSELFLEAINEHKNSVIVLLIQAILNILLSITTLYIFQDIKWVIISTIFALIITNLWYSPYYFYKKMKNMREL